MLLGAHVLLCVIGLDFFKKIFLPQKMGKMGQKQGFLNLVENLVINFFLNFVYKETL